jgi:SAM-dependent methyltransferase
MRMGDYRDSLYEQYGEFKREDAQRPLAAYFAAADAHYGDLLIKANRAAPVLELGCGPGSFLAYLRREGFATLEGIDISQEQVEIARQRGVNARVANAFDVLPTVRGCGLIAALDFIEHFSRDEVMRLLSLMHSALRDDGLLVLQTPNGQGLFPGQVIYGDLTHVTIFNPSSLQQALSAVGFGSVVIREVGPPRTTFTGRVRLLAWNGIKGLANGIRKIETGKTQSIWSEVMICVASREPLPSTRPNPEF